MLHHPLTHMTTPIPLSFPVVVTDLRLPRRPLPPLMRCCGLTSDSTRGCKGMSWFHEIELQVRVYELDQFGVVNNAVYSSYCEYVSHQLFDQIGFGVDTAVAVSEASYKYVAPLKKKDKFILKGRIYDYSAARLYFEGFIFKLPNQEPILECKATVVLLDKSLRPTRIPPSVISKLHQLRPIKGTKRDN